MKKWEQIFQAKSGQFSSKRVCGILGWIIVLGTYIYSVICSLLLPEAAEYLTWAIVALLGVDSVAGAFKRSELNEEN